MQMINDQGGINGRKIDLISVDDGFTPWRTGNETRKLIEVERVASIFGSIGTTTQLSVAKSAQRAKNSAAVHRERRLPLGPLQGHALHDRGRAPKLPARRAALRPAHPQAGSKCQNLHPLYGQRLRPRLYGRARDVLGDKYAATVKEATYESTDASIDRPIVELKATGCNALIAATIPPLAVQTIRKVHDLGWKPIFFMNNVSASVPVILEPAGLESSVGLLSSAYAKDPRDPAFENDPAMKDWNAWMSKSAMQMCAGRASSTATTPRPPWCRCSTGRRRSLAREYHASGDEPARPRAPDAAAWSQGLHQSDRLLCGPAVTNDAVRRQALGTLRDLVYDE